VDRGNQPRISDVGGFNRWDLCDFAAVEAFPSAAQTEVAPNPPHATAKQMSPLNSLNIDVSFDRTKQLCGLRRLNMPVQNLPSVYRQVIVVALRLYGQGPTPLRTAGCMLYLAYDPIVHGFINISRRLMVATTMKCDISNAGFAGLFTPVALNLRASVQRDPPCRQLG
jgi:hypothetical protein